MINFAIENEEQAEAIGRALILALSYFLKIVFTPEKPKAKKAELR